MRKLELEELRELLSDNHEVEFNYRDMEYCIVPVLHQGRKCFSIWKDFDDGESERIFVCEEQGRDASGTIDRLLNEKCIDGKSVMDIYEGIEFEWTY